MADGTAAADFFQGDAGDDTYAGLAGADTLQGGDGSDSLDGGDGDDILRGEAGDDTLVGGSGADLLVGASGSDVLDGGAGLDRASFFGAPAGVTVSLANTGPQATGFGTDTLLNIEHLTGSNGNDALTGDGGDNWLWGTGGSDTLSGAGGADLLAVGKGDHVLDGGAGVDTVSFYSDTLDGPVNVSLALQGQAQVTGQGASTLTNVENLTGTAYGGDTLAGDAGDNLLAGWGGADSLSGGGGNDVLLGDGTVFPDENAVITVYDEGLPPGMADTLDGGAGNDILKGGAGDDLLTGGAGADTLEGGSGADVALFSGARANYTVVSNGAGGLTVSDLRVGAPDGVDTLAGVETLRFADGDVAASAYLPGVNASGTAGGDSWQGGDGADTYAGLAGADTLQGGDGMDSLSGGADADVIRGQGGDDTLDGGAGADLLVGGPGSDVLNGGGGLDRVSYGDATGGVTVDLRLQGQAQATGLGDDTLLGIAHVTGSAFGDRLTGDDNANWLWGAGGADTVSAGSGADLVSLGRGDSAVDGGAGIDTVSFYSNTLTGGVRISLALQGQIQDTTQGLILLNNVENLVGAGFGAADTLSGDAGANLLAGWDGNDSLSGGGGNDTLLGDGTVFPDETGAIVVYDEDGIGADTLDGGSGDDLLKGGAGADRLLGGSGADTLQGGDGSDSLDGGDGGDVLRGDNGDDTLVGGSGADLLVGASGSDVLDGGAGLDRASFFGAPAGVTVSLANTGPQATGFGTDTLLNIEHLTGSNGNDALTGDGGDNWLWGTGGSDTLSGAGGADLLAVGKGDHVLDGGAGVDTVSFYSDTLDGPVNVSLALQGQAQVTGQGASTLTNVENLTGTAYGGDTLAGDAGDNLLAGWGGADSLSGGGGNDVLLGDGTVFPDENAVITVYDEGLPPGMADTLDGGAGNDILKGGAGDDLLLSGDGNDTLSGGAGADRLVFQAQANRIDLASGDGGADVFALDAGFTGTAGILDFEAGAGGDRLDLGAFLAAQLVGWNGTDNPFTAGFLRLQQVQANVFLQIDRNGGGDQFQDLLGIFDTTTTELTAYNLGYAPPPVATGGTTGDTFVWSPDSPVDTVDGGAGVDSVEIAAPAVVYGPATIQASPDGTALLLDVDGDGVTDLTVTAVEELVIRGERVIVAGDLSRTGLAPNTITYLGTSGDNVFDASGVTSVESVNAQGFGGADTLVGGLDDDILDGGAGDDSLSGLSGPDLLTGGAGADVLDGGAGVDVAVFTGLRSAYTVSVNGSGDVLVSGPDGSDRLIAIERLKFDDGVYGQNQAPSGQDLTRTLTTGGSRVIVASDFGFSDPDGDSLAGVKLVTLPAVGALSLAGVAVTVGQVISAADLAANRLVFTGSASGSVQLQFQVVDDGLSGWGVNTDASPNSLTFSVNDAPPPPPPPPANPVITSGSTGTEGNDVAQFGSGADTFAAGAGADQVSAGAGDDFVHGNAGADTLSGGDGADTLYGGRDNDVLRGDGGDDFITGDLGDDTLEGGAGRDLVFGGDGADRIEGGDGESYLRGDAGDDVITGGAAFDDINGNMGADTLHGAGGRDWVVGGKDGDLLFGDEGDDIVYGNLGDDTCNGGVGADLVRGGQGNDVLAGGDGDDWLSGDLGADTITGGAGADIFHGFQGAGLDRVLDFNAAEGDRVQLDPGSAYTVTQAGADTVIAFSDGGQMVLAGVQLSALPAGWIFTG